LPHLLLNTPTSKPRNPYFGIVLVITGCAEYHTPVGGECKQGGPNPAMEGEMAVQIPMDLHACPK
jgi:hypothetical protein